MKKPFLSKITPLSIWLLFLPKILFSQTKITGKITETNGKPIEFATVGLFRTTDKTLITNTFSDSLGVFELNNVPTGNYDLTVELVGFEKIKQPLTIETQANLTLETIKMTPSVQDLKTVTITARKPVIERKIDRLVYNAENSITAAGSTTWDLLAKIPSVRTTFDGGISASGKGVQVYLNDRPLRLSMEEVAEMLSNLPAEDVQKIEIITNPPARYDAQGGAIINIVTKKGRNLGWNGTLRGSYTQATYPKGSFGGGFNYRNDKLNVFGNYSHGRRTDLKTETEYFDYISSYWTNGKTIVRNSRGHNYRAGLDYNLGKNHVIGLLLDGSNRQGDSWMDSQTFAQNAAQTRTDSTLTTRSDGTNKGFNYALNANYKGQLDTNGRSINVDVDFAPYQSQRLLFINNKTQLPNGNASNFLFDTRQEPTQDISIFTAKIDFNTPLSILGKKYAFETGLKTARIQTQNDVIFSNRFNGNFQKDAERSNEFDYTERIQAAYINLNGSLGKWEIQLGLRGEYTQTRGQSLTLNQLVERDYSQIFPTVYLQRNLSENHQVSLYYGKRIERPDYWRLNPAKSYTSPFTYLEGNPFLQPAFNHSVDLQYAFRQKYMVSLIYNHTLDYMTNITVQDNANRLNVNTQANTDNSRSWGFSVVAPLSIGGFWEVNNYLQVTHKQEKSAFLGSAFDYKIWNAYFSSNHSWVLSKDKTWKAELNAWYVSAGIQATFRLESNWALDMGIKKSFADNRANLSLNFSDLFYSNFYRINVNYLNQRNGFVERNDTRSAAVSFSYKLGNTKVKEARRRQTSSDDEKKRTGG
jgi:Outer membrane protein beta-barrel family/Carboxypeptidase regulatory-like domain